MEKKRPTHRSASGRQKIFRVLTFLLVWISCELIIAVGKPSVDPPINVMDPVSFMKPYRSTLEKDQANGQGIRADHDYAPDPDPSVLRIATFGGSFVYGADVPTRDTWQYLMEEHSPRVEVMNFGVSGYGTDQALLRYRIEGMKFHPNIVVLGFIAEHSLRILSTFRPFYRPSTGLPLGKPRFRLVDGNLEYVPNPFQSLDDYRALLADPARELPRIGAEDGFYSQYEAHEIPFIEQLPSIGALRFWSGRIGRRFENWRESREEDSVWAEKILRKSLLLSLFDAFARDAKHAGAIPVFMLCPIDVEYRDGDGSHPEPYPAVKRFLRARGEEFIDLADVFEPHLKQGGRYAEFYAHGENGGHYSSLAHRLIEAALRQKILELSNETAKETTTPGTESPDGGP